MQSQQDREDLGTAWAIIGTLLLLVAVEAQSLELGAFAMVVLLPALSVVAGARLERRHGARRRQDFRP
jgi:hypothetical protein